MIRFCDSNCCRGGIKLEPISQQEIPDEILKSLGDIHQIIFPRQGHTSDVGVVYSMKGIAVLKRTRSKQFNEWLKRESYILDSLSNSQLPVPKVFDFVEKTHQNDEIHAWLLMEYLQGETLRSIMFNEYDSNTRYNIIFDFGRKLRELHTTPCPVELKSSGNWLDHMLTQAKYYLDHYNVDGTPQLLEELITNKPKEFKQTLIHGDFTIDNVLVHEGRISGIIDWSGGAYGDPRYDVSLAIRPKQKIFQSLSDHKAFFDGYGEKIITHEEYHYFAEGLYEFF